MTFLSCSIYVITNAYTIPPRPLPTIPSLKLMKRRHKPPDGFRAGHRPEKRIWTMETMPMNHVKPIDHERARFRRLNRPIPRKTSGTELNILIYAQIINSLMIPSLHPLILISEKSCSRMFSVMAKPWLPSRTERRLITAMDTGSGWAADAAIIAGMIHTGKYTIPQIKEHLLNEAVPVRKKW